VQDQTGVERAELTLLPFPLVSPTFPFFFFRTHFRSLCLQFATRTLCIRTWALRHERVRLACSY
jgi:hypothetical protein